ncbi:O-antigen ligase family protein [Lentisphaerota bacterium ZTH]|nr:O-antigen ligase family protein [Lentisphaerota bacterium]WET07701.1 O-antigen ligase family protein [Lentisphaerota bacterium ZTH]
MNSSKFMDFYRNLATCLVLLFTFLLPLKFGTLTGVPETAALFPADLFSWCIISWPTTLFPLFSGIVFLAALPAFGLNRIAPGDKSFRCAALWVILAAAGGAGMIRATVKDFVYLELVHLFGIAAYALTVFLVISYNHRLKYWLLTALVAGTFVTLLLGFEQYFFGFEETREYFIKTTAANGITPAGELKARVFDNRIFATFSSCNSLAGFLLLVIPLCFVTIWKFFGRVSPPIVARSIFVPLFTALMLFVLVGTRSRAAILALILSIAVCAVIFPINRWLRISAAIILPLMIIAGIFYIKYSSRSFDSIYSRLDYYRVAVKIFFEAPFLGNGWGEFFHKYMQLKQFFSSEAPHAPHSLVLAFASQCGIAGLVTSILVFFYPLCIAYKRARMLIKKNVYLEYVPALFLGLAAFFLHSLADVNLQVPASMAAAALFTVCMTGSRPARQDLGVDRKMFIFYLVSIIILVITITGGWHLFYGEYQMARLLNTCERKNKSREDFMRVSADEVRQRLFHAVKAKPYSPFPWASAADFMFARNNLEDAERYYYEAIKLAPTRSYLYERLFHLLSIQGRQTEARKYLEKSRQLNPMGIDAKIKRGIITLPLNKK